MSSAVKHCFVLSHSLVAGRAGTLSESAAAQANGEDPLPGQETHHGGAVPNVLPENRQKVSETTARRQQQLLLHAVVAASDILNDLQFNSVLLCFVFLG